MSWTVKFTYRTAKSLNKLEEKVLLALQLLVNDLETNGPTPGIKWRNYGMLRGFSEDKRHCHLIRGKPTYVCCWEVCKKLKIIEVYYVGTHEKAPY